MESRIFAVKNVKDVQKTKRTVLEKIRVMVSPDATLDENMINVQKETSWTKSNATITFTKKEKDLEIMLATTHSATGTAVGAGCILALFGLILIVVPWYLYDQDKRGFDERLQNVLNYAVQQG